MDGQFPVGAFFFEGAFVTSSLAAPFVEIGFFDAAATRAEDVVSEDEFMFSFTRFESLLEPFILFVAYRDSPPIAIFLFGIFISAEAAVDEGGRVPVVIENDK